MRNSRRLGSRNILLSSIPDTEFAAFGPYLQPVKLDWRTTYAGNGRGSIFIEDGLATMALSDADGRGSALALIGVEGMIGSASALGLTDASFEYRIQTAGHGLYIAGEVLAVLQEKLPVTRSTLLSYNQTLLVQFAETARANKAEVVESRLARWLLLCCDRLQTNELWLTHDELADCLGIRRAGVTDALHVIEGKAAIRSLRGRIIIRNRELLTSISHNVSRSAKLNRASSHGAYQTIHIAGPSLGVEPCGGSGDFNQPQCNSIAVGSPRARNYDGSPPLANVGVVVT